MELAIPTSLLSNLDIVIKYQNIQLIKEICAWKKWNADELINEFVSDTDTDTHKGKKKKKPLALKKSQVVINQEPDRNNNSIQYSNNSDNNSGNNSNIIKGIEIRTRTPWVFEKVEYMLETPHNNVYKSGVYVGRKVEDSIDEDYPEI
jgi:hypothetical protein